MNLSNQINESLNTIRKQSPLVHNLNNIVTMDLVANGLLAIGASPLMAHAPEETKEIINIANALSINIGTLDKAFIDACKIALHHAQEKNIPVVLDPVGTGATEFRTLSALNLLQQGGIKIIKGNASEILALSGNKPMLSKGVENTSTLEKALDFGKILAKEFNLCVVITGQQDAIISPSQLEKNDFGHPIMTKVTGMGCLLNSIIAAFAAIETDYFQAARQAVILFGICGQEAVKNLNPITPADFRNNFINQLYLMNQPTLQNYLP